MEFVEPIRNPDDIARMKDFLMKQSYRNYFLFFMGINTALRVSDLLAIKVKDVKYNEHLILRESKTKKVNKFKINQNLRIEIDNFLRIYKYRNDEYLFQSRNGNNKPLSRIMAYKILCETGEQIGVKNLGTHTMRKTFGYHAYIKTKDIVSIMEIFNHSSQDVTLRYIGINQDSKDEFVDGISL